MNVSVYADIRETQKSSSSNLQSVISGYLQNESLKLHAAQLIEAISGGDTDRYSILKSRLPVVLFSGLFQRRAISGFAKDSGLMVCDIDYKGLSWQESKQRADQDFQRLTKDPNIILMFYSPSGAGLKAIVRVKRDELTNEENHRIFETVSNYFQNEYGIVLDPSGKDISRACYVTYSELTHFNIEANYEFEPAPIKIEKKRAATAVINANLIGSNYAENFVLKVLRGRLEYLLYSSHESRHDAILRSSKLIGGYLASAPHLYDQIVSELRSAADQMYQETRNANRQQQAIESGLTIGMAEPIALPEKKVREVIKTEVKKKRYLSEALPELIAAINQTDRLQLVAKTGTGKTTAIFKALEEIGRPFQPLIFAVPTQALVQQLAAIMEKESIPWVACMSGTDYQNFIGIHNRFITTYDKVSEFNTTEAIVAIDESHNAVRSSYYRAKAIRHMNPININAERVIYLTGTPLNSNYFMSEQTFTFIPDQYKSNTLGLNAMRSKGDLSKAFIQEVGAMKPDGKIHIARFNSKRILEEAATKATENGFRVLQVFSNDKDDERVEAATEMIESQMISEDIDFVMCTERLDEGISFENVDRQFGRIMYFGENHPAPAVQFANRVRKQLIDIELYIYFPIDARKAKLREMTRKERSEALKFLEERNYRNWDSEKVYFDLSVQAEMIANARTIAGDLPDEEQSSYTDNGELMTAYDYLRKCWIPNVFYVGYLHDQEWQKFCDSTLFMKQSFEWGYQIYFNGFYDVIEDSIMDTMEEHVIEEEIEYESIEMIDSALRMALGILHPSSKLYKRLKRVGVKEPLPAPEKAHDREKCTKVARRYTELLLDVRAGEEESKEIINLDRSPIAFRKSVHVLMTRHVLEGKKYKGDRATVNRVVKFLRDQDLRELKVKDVEILCATRKGFARLKKTTVTGIIEGLGYYVNTQNIIKKIESLGTQEAV